jgi:hypothetical protein
MNEKKTGCQGSCPLGKVLGQRECPGQKAKTKLLAWLKGEAKKPPQAGPKEK